MRSLLIGALHLVIGLVVAFGWVTYGDSAGFLRREFDWFVNTAIVMGVFIVTAAVHAYWSGYRRGRRKSGDAQQ